MLNTTNIHDISIFIVFLLDFPPIVSIEENCSKFGDLGSSGGEKKRVFGEIGAGLGF